MLYPVYLIIRTVCAEKSAQLLDAALSLSIRLWVMGSDMGVSAIGIEGRGRRWQDFENRSTTTLITVLPLEGGR